MKYSIFSHKYVFTVICCLSISLFLHGSIFAIEVVENENHGKMLLLEKKEQAGKKSMTTPKRDPFNWSSAVISTLVDQHGSLVASAFKELTLSGIVWNSKTPLAIIDDTLLEEGDVINGVYVIDIQPDSVLLQKGNEQYLLEYEELVIDLGSGN